MTAITIQNVSKRFGNVQAIESLNLQIEEGEFVSIIGPSGCGKTTLLRIIAGLEEATSGEVSIFGDSPLQSRIENEIGVAFQDSALLGHRTALGNVQLTLEISNNKDVFDPIELLTSFGLTDFLHHHPRKLSGGMQQRVNIACALVHNPRILLLDEPFGALDDITRDKMNTWLGKVLEHTLKTVVLITHNIEESVFLSDRVVVMSPRPGKIYSEHHVCFERPRDRTLKTDEEFLRLFSSVRESLYEVVNGENE